MAVNSSGTSGPLHRITARPLLDGTWRSPVSTGLESLVSHRSGQDDIHCIIRLKGSPVAWQQCYAGNTRMRGIRVVS